MLMTQEADNAVRIVHCLATQNKRCDANTIAEQTGVSLRFSLKILHKLVGSGIVKSFKGQNGGYELARDPSQITLNDVIETVDGPCVLNKCLRDGHECSMDDAESCGFRAVFAKVSATVKQMLSDVTFDKL